MCISCSYVNYPRSDTMISALWGEIDPKESTGSSSLSSEVAEFPPTVNQNEIQWPVQPAPAEDIEEVESEEEGTDLSDMLQAVAESAAPVKSQQLGEPDLTLAQRRAVLLQQYRTRPLVFLERYQAQLRPEHLGSFAHLRSDCRAQHYCREVEKRASNQAKRTRVRNHRYAALRALQQAGQYFSEDEMRAREPLLYEQYIGQYLSDEELLQRSAEGPAGGPQGLADLLLHSYQEGLIQSRLQQQQDTEDGAVEETEEEEEEEEGHVSGEQQWEPSAEEKALLREEFVSRMHQRFLDGKDRDFDYSEVDDNPDYDNLDIVSRDEEERYFDEDEPEEDGEEDEEMQ